MKKQPYEVRIEKMNTSDKVKNKATEKLKTINKSPQNAAKAQKYLDGILKIPFGVIKKEEHLDDPGKHLMEEFKAKYPEVSKDESLMKMEIIILIYLEAALKMKNIRNFQKQL